MRGGVRTEPVPFPTTGPRVLRGQKRLSLRLQPCAQTSASVQGTLSKVFSPPSRYQGHEETLEAVRGRRMDGGKREERPENGT